MFRYDNPDALLVLLMTAAAYATARAIESGRTRWLVLTGGLLGFAFLTKMLQGFLVVPAFALAYLVAGPPRLGRRLWQLLAARRPWSRAPGGGSRSWNSPPRPTGPTSAAPRPTACCSSPWATTASAGWTATRPARSASAAVRARGSPGRPG